MQSEKLKNQKWVFVLAKHGLKVGIKISYILVSKREKNGREEQKGEKKRKRKRKKKKRKKRSSSKAKLRYGTIWFCMDFLS